ncbi:hypothetical protein LTR56_024817 [Elasticomyces elasticus]|nr:hypothetical protein LTR56_024817 [Elasticomyces elasticus]KAK3621798.1 hypothetical protein LTR22_025061 [Elasticomyces elasticus]KAK4906633.1 hypothetical protein LTR49_024246 [Elasticomyces elasticus]
MRDYTRRTLEQVKHAAFGQVISQKALAKARRGSICVKTLFALSAFGQNLIVPSLIREDDNIKRLEELSIDIVVIHNDLVSFAKERDEGVEYNPIINLQNMGVKFQNARDRLMDQAQNLIEKLFFEDNKMISQSPERQGHASLLSKHPEVREYVELLRLIPRVNLHWIFVCKRFRLSDRS